MNATHSYGPPQSHHGYMDQAHMAQPHPHAQPSTPSYAHYGHAAPIQPPPMSPYSSAPHGYQYSYGHPASAAPSHQQGHYAPQHVSHHMPLPPTMPSNQQQSAGSVSNYSSHTPDTTGQVAPPNHKPKLTGTVWEDEGTVCFQVEVKGICVARREDNCFINGTKLLNVANMTRGRRDGILKSEKVRNVIKIGPMHLKGVWIPFDRALDFANKEKITEQLYPLFVNNISPLLAPHFNQTLKSGRSENAQSGQSAQLKTPQAQTNQPPSSGQHQGQDSDSGSQSQHVLGSHQTASRPAAERPSAFPTPPTSASSAAVQTNNSYGWEANGLASSHALQAEAGMQSAKAMPPTPLTSTPPDAAQNMPYQTSQAYDQSRAVYSAAPAQQTSYAGAMYGQMQPPRKRDEDGEENKDYGHSYGAEYPAYNESHQQISPEMKTSSHPASGRGTPRSIISPGSHWQNGGYAATSRPLPAGNLAYVGADTNHHNGYATSTYTNGHVASSNKRSRDVEEDDSYMSNDPSTKKRKSIHENSTGLGHHRAALVQRQ